MASALASEAASPGSQPVFVVLYTQFYDHAHQYPTNERIDMLIPLLEKLRAQYPESRISGLFEFSGAISQVLFEKDAALHKLTKIKQAAGKGLIDVGYTGEEEPSYLYRPKAELLLANTPEKRWAAQAEAAERFLTDFKDPITGRPVPSLTGGLKRMQEIFGPAAFIRGVTELMGGDAPVTHEVRKLNATAMMMGIPPSDVRRGIESYGASADGFAKGISPAPNTSPEVFWEDGALRLSDLSMTDNRPHSTDESVDALKKAFAQLDRGKARVIALELGSYRRYLAKRADGSVIWDPMEWLYYHPDHPDFPPTMKPFLPNRDVQAGYKNEEAVLNWLLQEFFPANPGSRFLSIQELVKLAGPELPAEVSWDQIKSMAADLDSGFKKYPTWPPNFLRAGDAYFSDAQAFQIMAEALAVADKTGAPASSVKPVPMHGPIDLPPDMGPVRGSVTVRDVLHAAAKIAPALRNTEWKLLPENVVPAYVQIGEYRLVASQFLHLMSWVCADPSPDRVLTLSPIEMHSDLTFRYPRNTPNQDQGVGWTFKPAPLQLTAAGPTAGGQ